MPSFGRWWRDELCRVCGAEVRAHKCSFEDIICLNCNEWVEREVSKRDPYYFKRLYNKYLLESGPSYLKAINPFKEFQ